MTAADFIKRIAPSGSVSASTALGSSLAYLGIKGAEYLAQGWPSNGVPMDEVDLWIAVAAAGLVFNSVRALMGLKRVDIKVPAMRTPPSSGGPTRAPEPPGPTIPPPSDPSTTPPILPPHMDVEDAPDRTPPPANPITMSTAGLALLKEFEGFRADPYTCSGGKLTIGYGHVILPEDDITPPISEQEASVLLSRDVDWAETAVDRYTTVPLTQHQFDALVSFTFNVGSGAFQGSTLLRRLNTGEYDAVSPELMRWVHAGGQRIQGLVNRREREGRVFDHGDYS